MKKFIGLFIISLLSLHVMAQSPVFKWETTEYNFGKIKQGVPVTYKFKFTNVGKDVLMISNVSTSCGCTTPEWTKSPVGPGSDGQITVTYNASNMGTFNKTISITANTEEGTVPLVIKGEVVNASDLKAEAKKVETKEAVPTVAAKEVKAKKEKGKSK